MNQILYSTPLLGTKKPDNKENKFRIIFWIFFVLCIIFIISFIILKYNFSQKESYSRDLISSYEITTLYNNSTSSYLTNLYQTSTNSQPFVVGLIEIPKIDLMYPILSMISDDLLEISVCRFYGPMPNNIGNMCIAGHNYVNNKIFGKLYLLDINDVIYIYDYYGSKLEYIIYDKTEVEATDLSCLDQKTNNKREITLVTCNSLNGKRHILKAKENR